MLLLFFVPLPPPHPYINLFLRSLFAVSESKELPEVVRTVLKQEITRLFGDSNAKSFNQAYLTKHSSSIPHRLAGKSLWPSLLILWYLMQQQFNWHWRAVLMKTFKVIWHDLGAVSSIVANVFCLNVTPFVCFAPFLVHLCTQRSLKM